MKKIYIKDEQGNETEIKNGILINMLDDTNSTVEAYETFTNDIRKLGVLASALVMIDNKFNRAIKAFANVEATEEDFKALKEFLIETVVSEAVKHGKSSLWRI